MIIKKIKNMSGIRIDSQDGIRAINYLSRNSNCQIIALLRANPKLIDWCQIGGNKYEYHAEKRIYFARFANSLFPITKFRIKI